MDKPNVLFIMTDQQRADSFGPERHQCADYPVLERLASESAVFENFITAATPCVPSRHTFLTGRHSWMNLDAANSRFSTGDEQTWMSILRDNGYSCVSVGKTHMVHAGSFHVQIPIGKTFGDQGGWDHFHPEASPEEEERYFDIQTAARTCELTDRLIDRGPFAMFVGFHAPHEPYVMPEKYLDFCRPEDVKLPESATRESYDDKSEQFHRRVEHFKNKFGEMTDDDIKKGIAGHHCLMKMVDDCLGRILSHYEEKGLLDNTVVVYCSDHGDVLGEHRIFNKNATFYDSEVHIPMMIRFPDGSHKGKRVKHLASSLDYVPTILDILGVETDVALPGESLMPMIEKDKKLREYVVCSNGGGMMLRTEKYKFWKFIDSDGELYDLEHDPGEMNNLYNNADSAALKAELTEMMLNARMKDDQRQTRLTQYERLLHNEVRSTGEPEVV